MGAWPLSQADKRSLPRCRGKSWRREPAQPHKSPHTAHGFLTASASGSGARRPPHPGGHGAASIPSIPRGCSGSPFRLCLWRCQALLGDSEVKTQLSETQTLLREWLYEIMFEMKQNARTAMSGLAGCNPSLNGFSNENLRRIA